MKKVFTKHNRQLLKAAFVTGMFVSFFIYLIMWTLFYEFRFSVQEELLNVIKITVTGGVGCCAHMLILLLVELGIKKLQRKANYGSKINWPRKLSPTIYKRLKSEKIVSLQDKTLSHTG